MRPPRFTILVDGECPLCRREADLLRRMDRGRGGLRIVDIAAPGFDPGTMGLTLPQVMARIHGVTEDGTIVEGVEVFRRAYDAVGWGWLLAPTGWPGLRWISDRLYRLFAAQRLRLTGRAGCAEGRCAPRAAAGDNRA